MVRPAQTWFIPVFALLIIVVLSGYGAYQQLPNYVATNPRLPRVLLIGMVLSFLWWIVREATDTKEIQ